MSPARLRSAARRLLVVAALAVGVLAPLTVSTSSSSAATVLPDPAHPYSAPIWYPLGAPAGADCYRDNPGCGGYHGYWALDIDSRYDGSDEPVYAMGAGQLHYGASGLHCDGTQGRGNWVWIDHGAGVVSIYGHLADIRVPDGSWVTPKTRIGTVGDTGYSSCASNSFRYLYLAVRTGGYRGPYIEVPTMQACVTGQRQTWPSDLDARYPTWNDIPQTHGLATNLALPATDRTCIPDVPATPTAPAAPRVTRAGSGALTISWPAPLATDSVTSVRVECQVYYTSYGTWSYPIYRTVLPGSSTTFTGLLNGRPYRFRVNTANSGGWSATSPWTTLAPAAPPSATLIRGVSAWTSGLQLAWTRNASNGSPLTHFQVAIRRRVSTGYTPWVYTWLSSDPIHYNWYGLSRHSTYEMATRAWNAIGASPWKYGFGTTT